MLTQLRGLTGLCAAVIPAAVVVHLSAEALALGPGGLGLDFVLRHLYLAALVALSLGAFARALGLGRGRAEIRRRTALLQAQLTGREPLALPLVAAANLLFFGVTEAVEGVPLLSGVVWLGLAAGIAGSLLAALVIRAFGGLVLVAAVDTLVYAPRRSTPRADAATRPEPNRSRAAAAAFSLFVPNRPPPQGPSSDHFTSRKGTSCTHLLARRERRLRFSSLFSSC
ncbi:MAG TPA: hypothetical protein VGN14_13425 [Candidatus Elarobacter sp.]